MNGNFGTPPQGGGGESSGLGWFGLLAGAAALGGAAYLANRNRSVRAVGSLGRVMGGQGLGKAKKGCGCGR